MEVADDATLAPNAAAVAISAIRVTTSPPQPTPIVVHEARSHSSSPRMKSSIVRPRITPKETEATALDEQQHGGCGRERVVLCRLRQQDCAVDAEGQRKEQRALPETVAPALAHDEEGDHADSDDDVQRIFH